MSCDRCGNATRPGGRTIFYYPFKEVTDDS